LSSVILCDVSAPSTRDQYNFVNRVVLLLNTVILVVTFLLAYSSSSSQIGLLEASVRSSGGTQRIGVRSHDDVAFLRLVQSLGNRIQKLTRAQLRAVREAMLLYRQATSAAVSDALDGDGSEPRKRNSTSSGNACDSRSRRRSRARSPTTRWCGSLRRP